jgi:RNA polymerase sigma factor (TIGR02999 family)
MTSPEDTTRLLGELSGGNERAADELLPLVYDELKALASGYMSRERSDHTLQPTALIHEAYMRLVDQTRVDWNGRTHFKAVAAQAMQRVLIDYARGKSRKKRGDQWQRVPLDDAFHLAGTTELDAVALQDALQRMRQLDERQADVVEYRLFGGLTVEETARLLGVSERTVERDWKMGKTWLRRELSRGDAG